MASRLIKNLFGESDSLNLVAGSPMTAVVVASDHSIVWVEGDTLLPALGYAWPDEVIGEPVEMFLPENMRESHKGWFDSWINSPQERPLREAQPMTVQHKDGTRLQVRISTRQLYLEDGERFGEKYAGKPFRAGIAYVIVL